MYYSKTLAALSMAMTLASAVPTRVVQSRDILPDSKYYLNAHMHYAPEYVRDPMPAASTPSPPTSSGGAVPISQAAVSLIESLEGFNPNFYTINGDQTIGYGHDCTQRGGCSNLNPPITQAQGQTLLYSDLTEYEQCVCALPNASGLNANQYGAIVSFTYNSGCGGVQKYFESDMQNKDYSGICSSLPTTNTLNGELSSRRQKEGAFCSQSTTTPSGC